AQDTTDAELRGTRGDLAGVIRLHAADGDERVAALRQRIGDEVLQLPRLVAAVREPRVAVLALRADFHLAAEVLAQPLEAMHGRGSEQQWDAGEAVQNCCAPLSHGPRSRCVRTASRTRPRHSRLSR